MDIDFRFGRYQDVLADVGNVSVIICDPPYSDRTHKGRRTGNLEGVNRSGISYASLTESDAFEFAQFWSSRCEWWVVIFGDVATQKWHEEAWKSMGWYVFGPVRWVKPNSAPRFSGDGPTSSTEEIVVARRKGKLPKERIGSRPGHYIFNISNGVSTSVGKIGSFPGSKPINLMKALILDYTLKGDLVCDTHAGTGTTLLASAQLNRRSIGCEVVESTYNSTMSRIDAGTTPDMFAV